MQSQRHFDYWTDPEYEAQILAEKEEQAKYSAKVLAELGITQEQLDRFCGAYSALVGQQLPTGGQNE